MTDKLSVTCKIHGNYYRFMDERSSFKKVMSCPKCVSREYKFEKQWLDYLGVPSLSKNRNVFVKIGADKVFVDGFNPETKEVYLFKDDYWDGNLNHYHPEDKNIDLDITFYSLHNELQDKICLLNDGGYKVKSIWSSEFDKLCNESSISIIIENNKYARLQTLNSKTFQKIKNFLSFKAAGVEYTPAFKRGWNGITYLMDDNGRFLLGLIPKVEEWLNKHSFNYQLIDNRSAVFASKPIDLSNKLQTLGFQTRSYQERIVDSATSNNKGIVRACTGSGKTLCTALITAKLNKPTIIYVIGLDLLKQFHSLFSSLFDEEIGFIGNGTCEIHRINIASIWTIGSALKIKKPISDDEVDSEVAPSATQSEKIITMLKNSKVHIFDESHVVTTDTIRQIYDTIDPEHIYGFSGTPFRDDGSDMLINGILGEKIVDVAASELIAEGHLAQPIIKFVRIPKLHMSGNPNVYQGVYKEYIVDNIVRNRIIVNNAKQLLDKKYQTLILFKNISHGKNIQALLDEEGLSYEILSGTDSLERRMEVKNKLMSHEVNLVLASSIFDIGVDIPTLSALILAGGGKSSIRALQRVGRVIRKSPGKKFAAIVDFYDDIKFLKAHSQKRYKIYKSETGFKLIIPSNISDLK